MKRIYLSPPHMCGKEIEYVKEAFASNWIAPMGPMVEAFEMEFAKLICVPYATALSSGTGALHLALRIVLQQTPSNSNLYTTEVICPTLTFSASANVIIYEGCQPVFIDSDPKTWTIDPNLLAEELDDCARRGRLPRAVITVDLYGQCCDYEPIIKKCEEYGVPVIEDAAEALGATYQGRYAGNFGVAAAFSFNGNKIITTAGGGMLVSHNKMITDKARFLATQARDPAPHYQHSEIGFNYRLSNILAAIGLGQLTVLNERIAVRRRNFKFYQQLLGDLPGIGFMPEAPYGKSSRWLTCITIDPKEFGATVEDVRLALERENIEARPIWKPLHLQPVFQHCRRRGGDVAEKLFASGLCLPSGSALTEAELEHICTIIRQTMGRGVRR